MTRSTFKVKLGTDRKKNVGLVMNLGALTENKRLSTNDVSLNSVKLVHEPKTQLYFRARTTVSRRHTGSNSDLLIKTFSLMKMVEPTDVKRPVTNFFFCRSADSHYFCGK